MAKRIFVLRGLVITVIALMISGCSTIKPTATDSNNLNGFWIPTKQEIGGKELPPVAFQNQKLSINDSTYTFVAESEDKGSLNYSNGKMDIYGKVGVNAGKHFTAIYKIENGQLTICYNLKGDSYPEAFETKSKQILFLSVFQKGGAKYNGKE
jgi:uncharacterized protein (TIGR03067 family)